MKQKQACKPHLRFVVIKEWEVSEVLTPLTTTCKQNAEKWKKYSFSKLIHFVKTRTKSTQFLKISSCSQSIVFSFLSSMSVVQAVFQQKNKKKHCLVFFKKTNFQFLENFAFFHTEISTECQMYQEIDQKKRKINDLEKFFGTCLIDVWCGKNLLFSLSGFVLVTRSKTHLK